jgi:GNAT superfamily N-acetyltransferase
MTLYIQLINSKTSFDKHAKIILEFWNSLTTEMIELLKKQPIYLPRYAEMNPIINNIDELRKLFEKEFFKNKALNFFLIVHHQTPIGFVEISAVSKDTCGINNFFIRKQSRGKGLGTQILPVIKKQYKERGYKYMWLTVLSSNNKAIAIYNKSDFTEASKNMISEL